MDSTKRSDSQKLQSIVDDFVQNALEFSSTRRQKDFVAGNKFAKKLAKLGALLRHDFGEFGRSALADLMKHENPTVRGIAASDSLDFSPDKAESVLESIAKDNLFLDSHSAEYALKEWRAGRKEFPGGPVAK
ncbi:MAG TPA: DUF2019 domain-containing protein [Burkholderiales bacterium]|nr:DUF2019 domain-containing protein [Burkholderiales bacterium]